MSAHCTPKSRRRCKSEYRRSPLPNSTATKTSRNANTPGKKANICCICLEAIGKCDASTLDACQHSFHLQCITSWSQIENACPLCKTRFSHICHGRRQIAVSERKQEPAYQIELGNIIWVDCACVMCGSDDNEQLLLLCDGCDSAQHTYCAGLGDHVPDGDYYCDGCKSRFGDLLEMGLTLDTIFTRSRDTASQSRRAESVLAIAADQHCSPPSDRTAHNADDDEEYVPSPLLRRSRRNKTARIHASKQRTSNRKSHSQRSAASQRCHSSDEEYIPRSFDRRQQRRTRPTRPRRPRRQTTPPPPNIRRSERLRKHYEQPQQQQQQQRALTPDIEISSGASGKEDGVHSARLNRARSISPVSTRAKAVSHASSSLNELPSSSPSSRKKTKKKLVAIQANGRKRLLLSKPGKPSTSARQHAQNSLCKLFRAPMITATANSVASSMNSISILSQNNTPDLSSSSSSLPLEQCNERDDGDELFVPKDEMQSQRRSNHMIMTRSMKQKLVSTAEAQTETQSKNETPSESENDMQSALESEYVPSDTSAQSSDAMVRRRSHCKRKQHVTRSQTASSNVNGNRRENKCRKRSRQQMQQNANDLDYTHARKRLKQNTCCVGNQRKYSSLSNL